MDALAGRAADPGDSLVPASGSALMNMRGTQALAGQGLGACDGAG